MPLALLHVHHIAIICSNYNKSLQFYTEILGLELLTEVFRKERNSYKADLALRGQYTIELFSFPDPPVRPSYPEAAGLRHLAFEVADVYAAVVTLEESGIVCEPIREDERTGKMFFFIADPDGLPIEFYEK